MKPFQNIYNLEKLSFVSLLKLYHSNMIRDDDIYGSTNENKTYPTLALKKGDKPPP